MNTSDISSKGYNVSELKRITYRARFRTVRRLLLPFLLCFAVLFFIAEYISRLPRERHARDYNFIERVVLGGKQAVHAAFLFISAEHEDGATSNLPIAELYIRGERLDKLKESLPASGRDAQDAKFYYADEVFKVKARYRGDSMNHWAFPQRSYRIDAKKTDDIDGMRSINLVVPRADTQIANWLGYEIARRMGGLLVPDTDMVHFRLNRKFDGIRLLLEQPDQAFLRRRNLSPGKIFIGDISSEQIYGSQPRARLYHEAGAWEVRAPTEDIGRLELASLFRIIAQKDPYRLYYTLERLADVEGFLRYMALLEFVGSIHVDATHNGKMYFNPETGKFSPLVWDTVAYFWGNQQPLDLGTNELFRALLSVPEYRERKDQILWEMVTGNFSTEALQNLINMQVKRMRKDVYAFPLKVHANDKGIRHVSNAEWEDSIKNLLAVVAERNELIKDRLTQKQASYHVEIEQGGKRARLAIANSGVESLRFNTLAVRTTGTSALVKRIGIEDILKPRAVAVQQSVTATNGEVRFALDDILRSGRSFANGARAETTPGVYIYEIEVVGGAITEVQIPELVGATTETVLAPEKDTTLLGLYQKSTGWWEPERFVAITPVTLSGVVTLEEDLILDDYSRLVIEPGTHIRIAPERSILVRKGGVIAKGTADKPIRIEQYSADYPWGVFAVQGGTAELEHVHVSGGSQRKIQHVFYETAFALHNAEAKLKDLHLTDVELDLRNAKGSLDGLNYTGVQRAGYRSSNSFLKISNVKKIGRPPVHRAADYKGKVYGTGIATGDTQQETGARAEREYKLSLVGEVLETMPLDAVAQALHEALSRAVLEKERWSAPLLTNTWYYPDAKAKPFLFRDVYFDTKDRLNYQFGVSYRYRNRFKDRKDYGYHLKKPNWSEYWPYRLEFQAKVDREEMDDGFSITNESRFEFRTASEPFSETNVPPGPPWEEDIFIPYFLDGKYRGIATYPAKAVLEYLGNNGVNTETLEFEPASVLVTDRHRQHLNLKTDWGSGPNPEQSFIISLDHSEVYQPAPYLDYLRRKRLGYKKLPRPEPVGRLIEIELEFERNVSAVLDREIRKAIKSGDKATEQRLVKVRDAFLADLDAIKDALLDHFALLGIQVVPADKSKYLQSMDVLNQ